jgi:hypothetical protein
MLMGEANMLPQGILILGKNFPSLGKIKTEGKDNFPLGINSTVHTPLDSINRVGGNSGLAGQLGFAHELLFPKLSN